MTNTNATHIAYWPGESIRVCEKHLRDLQTLFDIFGVGTLGHSPCDPSHCSNCENESEDANG